MPQAAHRLSAGTRIGPYEVTGSLGAGGMGEVYRARDTKLDRGVALKILPPSFANDPDRLMRFEREAKTLAALNHPYIAQIYGLEQSGHASTLVMELVEGEDLSQRIAQGAMPLDEAVAIAKQIVEDVALHSRSGGALAPHSPAPRGEARSPRRRASARIARFHDGLRLASGGSAPEPPQQ